MSKSLVADVKSYPPDGLRLSLVSKSDKFLCVIGNRQFILVGVLGTCGPGLLVFEEHIIYAGEVISIFSDLKKKTYRKYIVIKYLNILNKVYHTMIHSTT